MNLGVSNSTGDLLFGRFPRLPKRRGSHIFESLHNHLLRATRKVILKSGRLGHRTAKPFHILQGFEVEVSALRQYHLRGCVVLHHAVSCCDMVE